MKTKTRTPNNGMNAIDNTIMTKIMKIENNTVVRRGFLKKKLITSKHIFSNLSLNIRYFNKQ